MPCPVPARLCTPPAPPFTARHTAAREVGQRIGSSSEGCAPCRDGRPGGRRCRSGYSRRCRPVRRTAAGCGSTSADPAEALPPIWRDFGGQGAPAPSGRCPDQDDRRAISCPQGLHDASK
jgi:hypothetical protein